MNGVAFNGGLGADSVGNAMTDGAFDGRPGTDAVVFNTGGTCLDAAGTGCPGDTP